MTKTKKKLNPQKARNDIHAIDAMYSEAIRSFEAGDLASVLDHWNEDGVYLWPAVPPAIKKKAIRAAYEGFFAAWKAKEIYLPHEIAVSGDLGYRRFSTDLTLTPKLGGKPTRMKLNGIHVYKRGTDGRWRFQVVIAINAP